MCKVKGDKEQNKLFYSEDVLFRIGGLPFDTMELFKHRETVKVIRNMLNIDDRLTSLKGSIDSVLFDEIKSAENDDIRRKLINIKREIKKGKVHKQIDYAINELDYNNRLLLEEFVDLLNKRKIHTEQVEGIFNRELTTIREHLQNVSNDEEFLKGVLLSSESLFSKIYSYVSTPINEQNKKLRKVEKNLMMYLSRVTAKTSPFSTFTPVSFGRFDRDKNVCSVDERKEKRSLIRINYIMVLYLQSIAEKHLEIKKDLPILINKNIRFKNNKLTVFRSKLLMNGENPKTLFCQESFVKIEMNRIIETVVNILDGSSQVTYSRLIIQLKEVYPSLEKEKIEKFVNKLIDYQLIECKLDVPDNSEDILRDFIAELNRYCTSDVAKTIVMNLKDMEECVNTYGGVSAWERKLILSKIQDLFEESCRMLSGEVKKITPIIFEDTSYQGDFNLKTSDWWETKKNLGVLQRIVSLFSVNLPYSITFKEFFVRKYGVNGRSEDVLGTLDEYGKFFKDTFDDEANEYNPYNLELMDTVNKLKGEFYYHLQDNIANNDSNVELDINWMKEFSEKIPEEVENIGSNSYFVQPYYDEENKLMVVLNRIASGYGQFMSRFEPLHFDRGEDKFVRNIRENYQSILPEGHAFAELNGTFGYNGNVHKNMATYEFSYPGISTSRSKEEKFLIGDIEILHSAKDNQLYFKSVSNNLYLHPLYLGFLTWYLLPPIYRMIFLMVPSTYFSMPISREYYNNVPKKESNEKVIKIPRIQIGNIVLSKRQWWIPKNKFNEIEDSNDVNLLLSVERWRRENGLPKEFFLHLSYDQKEFLLENPSSYDKNKDKDIFRKPQYIDLENIYLIKLLYKNISYCNRFFVIEEVLPTSQNTIMNGFKGNYATEIILELNYRR
ncbi:lantibiotic dehydratase [Halobacillus sp. H74]|uniref:lantibiotic dehydratase n=1 Tax=Halobacillus sp. H74 TaxID=3457436 RepID=UPI003FCD21C7